LLPVFAIGSSPIFCGTDPHFKLTFRVFLLSFWFHWLRPLLLEFHPPVGAILPIRFFNLNKWAFAMMFE